MAKTPRKVPDKETLTEMRKTLSVPEMAKQIGCTKTVLRKWLIRYEIKIEQRKKYTINEDFFKEITNESAYVLGLIASDGCIIKRNNKQHGNEQSFVITSTDTEIVETTKKLMESTHKIVEQEQLGYGTKRIYHFRVYNKNIVSDLENIGIHQRKSLTIQFPVIDMEYVPDFMRGFHDGNGSFFISKKRNILTSNVVSTLELLTTWKQKLSILGINTNAIPSMCGRPHERLRQFILSGQHAMKFGEIIYYDENIPKLTRKYNIWKKYKQ
jgi:intein-encoded DNA endonuclease-like protein